jgi:serine/threonine protein kinase
MATNQQPHGRDLIGQVTILLQPGKRYRWVIGTGGFSTVYKGKWHRSLDDPPLDVAIKIFRTTSDPASEDTSDARRRLIRETNTWLRLSHRNIQPDFGHCSDLAPSIALISPYCVNGTVMGYIKTQSANNHLRLKLVADVVNGLAYLHTFRSGVVHGDLKPSNILVDDAGNARLTDFGRAKVVGETGFTTELCAGSAPYMAPELLPKFEGEENVNTFFTRLSDIYAFAMVAFEIFTDEIPYQSLRAKKPGPNHAPCSPGRETSTIF